MNIRRSHPIKKILFASILLLAASLLSGCAGGGMTATSWPGLTIDATHAYIAYGPAIYNIDLTTGQEIWHYPQEANRSLSFYAPPAVSDSGIVVGGGYNNNVYAIEASTGSDVQLVWEFDQAKDRIVGAPTVVDQVVLVPSADGLLYALDLNSGEPVWQKPFQPKQVPDPLWSKPAIEDDRIYLASLDHYIYALDLATGEQIWSTDLSGAISDTPTLVDGILLAGTFSNTLNALEAKTGAVRWSIKTEGWVWGNPAVSEGIAYFGDVEGTAYAVSIEDGLELWRRVIDGSIAATPAIGAGGVYFVTESGVVYAADPETGASRWSTAVELSGKLLSDPIFNEGKLLIVTLDPDCLLYEIDAETGAVRCMFQPAN